MSRTWKDGSKRSDVRVIRRKVEPPPIVIPDEDDDVVDSITGGDMDAWFDYIDWCLVMTGDDDGDVWYCDADEVQP